MIKSKYFGNIDINNIEECYEFELKHKNTTIHPLLLFEEAYFSTKMIQEKDVKFTDDLIDKHEFYIEKAFKAIKKSFKKRKVVREYIEHHFTEFDETELTQLSIDPEQSKKKIYKEIFNKLYFTGLIIDPTKKNKTLTLDFTFSRDLTQYIIAVRMNKNGKISEIDMES